MIIRSMQYIIYSRHLDEEVKSDCLTTLVAAVYKTATYKRISRSSFVKENFYGQHRVLCTLYQTVLFMKK